MNSRRKGMIVKFPTVKGKLVHVLFNGMNNHRYKLVWHLHLIYKRERCYCL